MNRRQPNTIFIAPRLVSLVAGGLKPFRVSKFFAERKTADGRIKDSSAAPPGDHERRGAAHAHAVHQPLLQERYCSPAAHVQRHTDGGRHQHAEALVLPEQSADEFAGDVDLVERRQQDAQRKTATKFPATWGRWPGCCARRSSKTAEKGSGRCPGSRPRESR